MSRVRCNGASVPALQRRMRCACGCCGVGGGARGEREAACAVCTTLLSCASLQKLVRMESLADEVVYSVNMRPGTGGGRRKPMQCRVRVDTRVEDESD